MTKGGRGTNAPGRGVNTLGVGAHGGATSAPVVRRKIHALGYSFLDDGSGRSRGRAPDAAIVHVRAIPQIEPKGPMVEGGEWADRPGIVKTPAVRAPPGEGGRRTKAISHAAGSFGAQPHTGTSPAAAAAA